MEHTYQPLFDRVLLKRLEGAEEKSAGGIIIPDAAKEKSQIAEVMAVGQGRIMQDGSLRSLQLQVGDKVLFGKYAGTEIEKDLVVVREDDILAIVK